MERRSIRWAMIGVLVLAAGCAAGPNALAHTPNELGVLAGFWRGLWHGAIAPVTLVVSLFSHHVRMYEVHNNGGWYDFGFLCGVIMALGGGASGRAAGRRWGSGAS